MKQVGEDFDGWYAVARPRVVAAMLVFLADRDRAEDAVDEAFLRALARWDRVRRMPSPTGWVVRVAQNIARRAARRSDRERRLLRRAPRPEAAAEPMPELWVLVRGLPERQRELVVFRYVVGLAEAEIASLVGLSRSTVSTELTGARRTLGGMWAEPERDLR